MQDVTPSDRWAPAPEARAQILAARPGEFLVATPSLPEGHALFVPILWVAGGIAAGAAYLYGGIEGAGLALAAIIALYAFVEPRATLWLATAFMVFLFVFFQTAAPLGDDLPEEFLYWGIGIALITAGLAAATFFSSKTDWAVAKRRFRMPASIAMLGMLVVILTATTYGLLAGNQAFAVARQFFGCALLPMYYFLALALFRSTADVSSWVRRVSWVVALGSAWYVQRLSLISLARGTYYREQSPLTSYSGAIAIVALSELVGRTRVGSFLKSLTHLLFCLLGILMMGNRGAMGSVLAAGAAVVLLAIWRRRVLALALVACLLPVAMGVAPYVMTRLAESPGLVGDIAGRFIFVLSEDNSYQGRVAQTEAVMNIVGQRPILGAGMGSFNSFFQPGEKRRVKVASVDNGWGYLLLKMGLLGLAAFLTLTALLLKRGFSGLSGIRTASLRANRLAVLGVFLYALVSLLSGPIFFNFSVAPFFATTLGALVVLGESREPAADAPATGRDPSLEQKERNVPCLS